MSTGVRGAAARALWALPGAFLLASGLAPGYGLRCVVFHDIAETPSRFNDRLGVTMHPQVFEERLAFLLRHYEPLGWSELRRRSAEGSLPARPLLITFDDAYASVPRTAAPILERHGVPSLFFVNAAFLDDRRLAVDNLLCWTANEHGLATLEAAAGEVAEGPAPRFADLDQVLLGFLPSLSRADAARFYDAVARAAGVDPQALATEAGLYATREEIAALPARGMEIGSHTFSHVWCRSLDAEGLEAEIEGNRRDLAALCGAPVDSFSVPFGSARDLTEPLARCLDASGNQGVFLVEGLPNGRDADLRRVFRVAVMESSDHGSFLEIEVLPRLRHWRERLRGAA